MTAAVLPPGPRPTANDSDIQCANPRDLTPRWSPNGDQTSSVEWCAGEGLTGPRAGECIDKYPALWGTRSLSEFIERYAWLGDECKVWLGDEASSDACLSVCEHIGEICASTDAEEACLEKCPGFTEDTRVCLEESSSSTEAQDCT